MQEVEICNEGVEVDKRKFSSKNKNDIFKAASPTVIWEAAFQTCKGNLGFVVQEFIQRQKYADELPKAGNIPVIDFSLADSFIFPLLITTAPLPICTDDEAIDLLSGNYKGSMPRKSVPWLILNYPFTPSHNSAREHFSVLFEGYMELKDRAQNYKEGIFILNAAHIIDFFLWFRSAI